MANPEEVEEWLKKATEDRLVVQVLLQTGEELTLPCMFHLQQMLEKLLKALILVRGQRFERTHDLSRLTSEAEAQDIQNLMEVSETLNLFAVNGRYPGDLPEISISTALKYYEEVEVIRENLLTRIQRAASGKTL